MNVLELDHVSHRYGDLLAVDDLSLSVGRGELVCLLGPSGCGKTTALRLAAGLERLQRGRVLIDRQPVADEKRDVPPEERNVGLVFQDYALFPHLDVRGNVEFGLRGWSPQARHARAQEVLRQVGMAEMAKAHPHMLSGGQQQRVALARALAPNPEVMLLDEPFSGLDATLRNQIRDETLHVLKQAGAATLMVTHDPEEAMFMADRVAMMCGGRLIQCGPPAELYSDPADKFVASFFGDINRLQGTVRDGRVATPFGAVDAPGYAEGSPVEVLIRPEALRLQQTSRGLAGPRPAGQQAARVMASRLLGRSSMIHLAVDGAAPGPGDGPGDGPGGGPGERADAPPEAAAGGGGVHVHARIPGRFLPPENELLEVELDRSQTFVFPADGVT